MVRGALVGVAVTDIFVVGEMLVATVEITAVELTTGVTMTPTEAVAGKMT